MKKVNHFQKCCGDDDVPSRDEITALNALRDIKERVRRLKKRRSEISSLGGTENRGEVEKLERVLSQLKLEWNEWEGKRQKAARERMIRLGHEER